MTDWKHKVDAALVTARTGRLNMTDWKNRVDAALVDLQAALDGPQAQATGHISDAVESLNAALEILETDDVDD